MKFIKKPVVVEAIQWTGNNAKEISDFAGKNVYYYLCDEIFDVRTLEGEMILTKNNWLIKGVKGEFYPCRDDIFRESYTQVRCNHGDSELNVGCGCRVCSEYYNHNQHLIHYHHDYT